MTLRLQLPPQVGAVLDDAVVDQSDAARTISEWMGIPLRRSAAGGPPGVSDANSSLHAGERALKVTDLTLVLVDEYRIAVDRDTRRIITPVLEAFEAVDDNIRRSTLTRVSYDPTHQ